MRPLCIVAVALALAGCQDRFERARRETALVRVTVPRARTRGIPLEGPRTRVLVLPDRIHVDQAELAASWPQALRQDLEATLGSSAERHLPLVVRAATRLSSGAPVDEPGALLLPGLARVLARAAGIEKEAARIDPERPFRGALAISLPTHASYELVTRIVYTASQSEYERCAFALADRAGTLRWIETEAPGNGRGDPEVAVPWAEVGPWGIQVRASPAGLLANPGAAARLAALDELRAPGNASTLLPGLPATPRQVDRGGPAESTAPPPPARPWLDKVMLGPAGACPSVPRTTGKLDLPALASLLRETNAMTPGGALARVSAARAVLWSEVAAVLETIQVETPYRQLQLGLLVDEGPRACDGAMRPAPR